MHIQNRKHERQICTYINRVVDRGLFKHITEKMSQLKAYSAYNFIEKIKYLRKL